VSALRAIEVVRDVTGEGRPDEGFLRLRRLVLRDLYEDGTRSPEYPCDMVSRRRQDAVAVVLWGRGADRRPWVALRECNRPPVYLRRGQTFVQPDDRHHLLIPEVVAGLLEDEDAGSGGTARRAAAECREEAGYVVEPGDTRPLGAPLFPSPGITDEKVHFRSVEVVLEDRGLPTGDGSVMESSGRVVLLPLAEAVKACRRGEIPDMKTEVALLRLCDEIGYLHALDRFLDDAEGLRRGPAAPRGG
jgi:ADP-ribose pyrophosphatase